MLKGILITGWILFIIIVFLGSYGVMYFESQTLNPSIVTYEDALWWSINVSSAVGDCDLCPKTTGARVISTIMMIVGYAIFVINIGALSSYFKTEIHVHHLPDGRRHK
jgi:voltage-gated potassium channel